MRWEEGCSRETYRAVLGPCSCRLLWSLCLALLWALLLVPQEDEGVLKLRRRRRRFFVETVRGVSSRASLLSGASGRAMFVNSLRVPGFTDVGR